MVGIPKSTGCEICRKRKKKCGEEKPQCRACMAAGWKCPGYVKKWKFVDENSQLLRVYEKKKYIFESASGQDDDDDDVPLGAFETINRFDPRPGQDVEGDDDDDDGNIGAGTGSPLARSQWLLQRAMARQWNPSPPVPRPLLSATEKTGAMLDFVLTDARTQELLSLQALGAFFVDVPARLGRNAALDASTACLCTIYTDFLARKDTSTMAIRRYAQSLNSLNSHVHDPRYRAEPETLCASIIVQLCELMISEDNGRWSQLSRGSQVLIAESGPSKFTTRFERLMLESQRALFICQSIFVDQECFLAQQEWRDFLRASTGPFEGTSLPKSWALRSQLCDFLPDVPPLMREASHFLRAALDSPSPPSKPPRMSLSAEAADLGRRVLDMKSLVERWAQQVFLPQLWKGSPVAPEHLVLGVPPEQVPATPSGSPIPNSTHSEILFVVLDAVIHSIMLQLDKILVSLAAHARFITTTTAATSTSKPSFARFRTGPGADDNDNDGYEFDDDDKTPSPSQPPPPPPPPYYVFDPALFIHRCEHARRAFDYVKSKSRIASKTLHFTMSQFLAGDELLDPLVEAVLLAASQQQQEQE